MTKLRKLPAILKETQVPKNEPMNESMQRIRKDFLAALEEKLQ